MRAKAMCLCNVCQPCRNRTEVHVLQHERERRHAFGTVRLLRISLARLVVHRMPRKEGSIVPMPVGFPQDAGVLYPGAGSIDLAGLAPDQRPSKLVVIDGTWSQAHCMVRDSPWLGRLPRYALYPAEPSRYRIRKEPRQECLSTLESTAMALRLLEPENGEIDTLLQLFDRMVSAQLACIAQHQGETKRKKVRRGKPMRAIPEALYLHPDRVVVVYGESGLPRSRRDRQHRDLAQWSAIRMNHSEEFFDGTIAGGTLENARFRLRELGWTGEAVARAEPLASLVRRWKRFTKPGDVFVAWNKGSARLAEQHGLADRVLVLKQMYGNIAPGSVGTLEQVIAREGLDVAKSANVAGRASIRLARARAAALYLCCRGAKSKRGRET